MAARVVELQYDTLNFAGTKDVVAAHANADVWAAEWRKNSRRSVCVEQRDSGAESVQYEPERSGYRRRAGVCNLHHLRDVSCLAVMHESAAIHRHTWGSRDCTRHEQVAQVIDRGDVVVTAEYVGLAHGNGVVDERQFEIFFHGLDVVGMVQRHRTGVAIALGQR